MCWFISQSHCGAQGTQALSDQIYPEVQFRTPLDVFPPRPSLVPPGPEKNSCEIKPQFYFRDEMHSVDASSSALFVSPDLLPLVQTAPHCRHNLNTGLGQRPTVLSLAQQTAQLETTNPLCSLLNNIPRSCRSKDKTSE